MRIAAEPANSADGKALLAAMDIFAVATYPEFEIKNMWDAAHIDREAAAFLIARGDDGAPLACGALFLPEPGVARINRMYVSEQARGRGFGGALLTALEELAIARGAHIVRLETGFRQTPALTLYRSRGYIERDPFPPYEADGLRIFFEKPLPRTSH